MPPQPFREADPSGAGFVPPRRDPRRDLPGGSFAGCESTGRGGGESEADPGRPRKMQAGVMHPSASTQDLIRATRPKFPEGLKVRRTTRIAAERCPARFPSGTRIGVTYSTSSAAVEISPDRWGAPPRLATTGSDVPRDPPTQVLVVVRDEARHAPIKKLLQEIGYKRAPDATAARVFEATETDFFPPARNSYLGLLLGRSFLVDPRALSRRGARAARKSRGIAPHAVSGRCTRRIDSTRARREPRARPRTARAPPRTPSPVSSQRYCREDTWQALHAKSEKKTFSPKPPRAVRRSPRRPPPLPPPSPPQ